MLVLLLLLYHSIASTVVSASPNGTHYSYHELWMLQNYFWQNFLYPTNRGHIEANDSSIFAADVGAIELLCYFQLQWIVFPIYLYTWSSPSPPIMGSTANR